MLQEERLIRIVDFLKANGAAKLSDLCSLNSVSIDTVRRDIDRLEKSDVIKKVHGGAVLKNNDNSQLAFDGRTINNLHAKKELASHIPKYVSDGQTIALNSGTTNIEIARYLAENYSRLTIITNNLRIVEILASAKQFNIILLGGIFDVNEYSVYGKQCERDILQYNINLAVISVNAISIAKGLTDFRMNEIPIIQNMIASSEHAIVAADSSKFERIAYMNICPLGEIDAVITDSGLSPEIAERYTVEGIKIIYNI
jgi:DeoR family transcriptional regulator, fructose operon transcriptional repressor